MSQSNVKFNIEIKISHHCLYSLDLKKGDNQSITKPPSIRVLLCPLVKKGNPSLAYHLFTKNELVGLYEGTKLDIYGPAENKCTAERV